MADMQVGEVVFGGVGSGLYGMLLFVVLSVFISGLMVGRTPEFLGKKIEAREVKLTVIGAIATPMVVLATTGAGDDQVGQGVDLQLRAPGLLRDALRLHVAGATTTARRSPATPASSSPPTRISSASRSRTCSAAWRCWPAASCRCWRCWRSPARWPASGSPRPGLGTFRTDSPTFVVVLVAVILIVALLTFVPALLLGPVVQAGTDRLF